MERPPARLSSRAHRGTRTAPTDPILSFPNHPNLSSSLETRRDAVDDGTGCLECVVWLNSAGDDGGATLTAGGGAVSNGDFSIDLRGLRLGALVRCQGRVAEYREKLQLKVDAVQRCDDANAEPLFWLDHARCVANIHAERAGDAGERCVS